MNKALIVKAPFAGMIVDGEKTMEMRSMLTKARGRVGIIEQGTGFVIGSVEIIGCRSFAHEPEVLKAGDFRAKHRVSTERLSVLDKWCVGWYLKNPIRFSQPIEYQHPQGAVTWVRLPNDKHKPRHDDA